jgi:uncharacterized membrane protein
MYCSNCGAEVNGAFCGKCGAAMGAQSGAQQTGASGTTTPVAGGLTENIAGALCYVLGLITGILFLAMAPYNQNPRIRFHAWQSILLSLAVFVIVIAETILSAMMPLPLLVLFGIVQILLSLAFFGLWLFMMWKTYNNETVELPVIGPIAKSQAGL